jgi:lysophospholipase
MTKKSFDRRSIPTGAEVKMLPGSGKWPLRTFHWPQTRKARGTILFQGGRGDFWEKYLETFEHWHAEGWNIFSFDWRGQGGSGRLSPDPHVGHAQSFAPWINDLAVFWERVCGESPGPHVLMGHSMGGHLALRAAIEGRVSPQALVLIAPMLGFDTAPLPFGIAKWFAGKMCEWGAPERAAWKSNEKPVLGKISRQSLLTSDDDRYADELWWRSQNAKLELGPPSWAWVAEAYRSTAALLDEGVPEKCRVPTLLLGTEGDKLVSPKAIRNMAARLPRSELKMFDKSVFHEILRERDAPRDLALLAIDRFLDVCAA